MDELMTMGDVVRESMQDGVKEAVMGDATTSVLGSMAKDVLLPKDAKGPRMANFFSGRKPNGFLVGGAAIIGAAATIKGMGGTGPMPYTPNRPEDANNVLFGSQGIMARKNTQVEQVVNPSVAAAGRAPSTGNAPNLSASGDMVFGMHNKR